MRVVGSIFHKIKWQLKYFYFKKEALISMSNTYLNKHIGLKTTQLTQCLYKPHDHLKVKVLLAHTDLQMCFRHV